MPNSWRALFSASPRLTDISPGGARIDPDLGPTVLIPFDPGAAMVLSRTGETKVVRRAVVALFSGAFRRSSALENRLVTKGVVSVIATALCGGVVALAWFGYFALAEWERGADLLMERRQAEAIALVSTALRRDMEGAWSRVLVPINRFAIEEDPPYDLIQRTARAFARFPYPESFFTWRLDESEPSGGVLYVFNRAIRRPHWNQGEESGDPYPVVVLRDPPAMQGVVTALRLPAAPSSSFVVIEVDIEGVPYQIIACLLFSPPGERPTALVGFTVNLSWIRQEYFGPLLREIARIGANHNMLSFSVTDDRGRIVTSSHPPQPEMPGEQRSFPLLFLGSALVSSMSAPDPLIREWTVHVKPSGDQELLGTPRGARETFALLLIASGVSLVALLLTVRMVRASARLASMESEFVSTVTHDLKTPLALIRLVGDTLGGAHALTPETVKDYAGLLSREASNLSRAIENVLTYARYHSARKPQATEFLATDVWDLVEQALTPFYPTLERLGFDVTVDVPHDLPPVLVDRTAMIHVLDNIIANAIKYSDQVRTLRIVGCRQGRFVQLKVADQGIGICDEDVAYVCDRFYRGKNATGGGSGLGLAIVRRIVGHHGGDLALRSTLGRRTEVAITLVIAS